MSTRPFPTARLLQPSLIPALLPALLLASACSEEGLAFTPPYLTASAEVIDFGERVVGTRDQRTVFLINKGEVSMSVELPRYDTLNAVFGVQIDGSSIEPNKDLVVAVGFSPRDPVAYTTTVTIPNNSSNQAEFLLVLKGTGIRPGPCDGVECRRAPPPTCVGENTTRRYEPLGECMEGECVHEFRDDPCTFGCDDTTGACRGDPCIGMSCSTPPNNCYFANGMCEGGACRFEVNNAGVCDDGQNCTVADRCSEGTCVGLTKTCTTPPSALCVDANTRRVFTPQGACNNANGACEYTAQEQHCEFGCRPEGCVGDPCAGVTCDTPPASQCYASMGTCTNGVCSYATVAGACDDGNACTTGDTCNAGTCAGAPVVCNTPPTPDCASPTEARVYNAAGTCSAGTCVYAPSTRTCDDNNQCTTGDRCENGMCTSSGTLACNDNNGCTTDTCDAVAGCRYTGVSGPACQTGSGECPTGQCASGACLPVPNVTCVAEYQVDLCQEVEVAGVCSASGDCVVTQAPPNLRCPGCNGICLTCFFIQICLPF